MESVTVVLPFNDGSGQPISVEFGADTWECHGTGEGELALDVKQGSQKVAEFAPGQWVAAHDTAALRSQPDDHHGHRHTSVLIDGKDPVADLAAVFRTILDQVCPTYKLETSDGEAMFAIKTPAGMVGVGIMYHKPEPEPEPEASHG